MKKKTALRLAAGVMAAAGLAVSLAPAAAAAQQEEPRRAAPTALVLTVQNGTDAGAPADRGVTLSCYPTGAAGDHPLAAQACSDLARARGDIASLDLSPLLMCNTRYAPVTVTASGLWRGKHIHYAETFSNSCHLKSKGSLFQFGIAGNA
ncbi:SSI family serine proteinase inhibitor [Streptomyces sp. NPDC008121]|uniref:subtilase-type protease inhibitor n=1 Tax=Streptomyces sp. NPDC008121 TaxID=3364809 RepID=UPI0036E35AF1